MIIIPQTQLFLVNATRLQAFDELFDCFLKQIFHKKKCLNYKILSGS